MASLKDLFQTADWKQEKHIPVIEVTGNIEKGKTAIVNIVVGKEIVHPNTTEHHIRFVDVYFHPNGEKFPYQLAKFEFTAHGESISGPNMSTVYTQPEITFSFKTEKSGMLFALALCNIHGLWESTKEINLK